MKVLFQAVQAPVRLSKTDAGRAMIRHHFTPCPTIFDAFQRLRSVQFDPIAPVGCNHDLVLQARVDGYRVGDWQKAAYQERLIYDGLDKQACLIPFEGWPLRRIYYQWQRNGFTRIFKDHPHAVEAVLKEIETNGPLMPKELAFQERKEEWKDSWYGPSLTKQTLRALWHAGLVMTTGRRKGQHIYDLTERVVPSHLFSQPLLSETQAVRGLVLERHRAVGILRPNAQAEVWSLRSAALDKRKAVQELILEGTLVPLEVEGVRAHATPQFLSLLDLPAAPARVVFVAPLDQFVWDRRMLAHLFGFEYIWEIYVPEPKRRWGYYVLPVLYGDSIVARAEFWSRKGILHLRRWLFETEQPGPEFFTELERALRQFMKYSSATEMQVDPAVDERVRDLALAIEVPPDESLS